MNELSHTTTNPHGGDANAVAERLGLETCPAVTLDFSVNVNPLGPPPELRQFLLSGWDMFARYPSPDAAETAAALAAAHALVEEQVLVGNGSTDLFSRVLQYFRPRKACGLAPCYAGYREICVAQGVEYEDITAVLPENDFQLSESILLNPPAPLVFLTNPNNPAGCRIACASIIQEAAVKNRNCIFVVDESFMDFSPVATTESLIAGEMPENLIVIKSLTKFFAIPGVRLGMLAAHPRAVAGVSTTGLPWSVNALAQSLGKQLYKNSKYVEQSREQTVALREFLRNGLESISGFHCFPSETNFVLVKLPEDWPASRLQKELLKEGILIRSCFNFSGLDDRYCRLAVRPRNEISEFLEHLKKLVIPAGKTENNGRRKSRTPAIMVVGTTSNAGKSVVAAGICRVLARREISVAPFKAQNMALNSFVTEEGGEMGRAQVVQAYAAGVQPHTDMNPVLIKPTGDSGSQVIVNGKPIGNFQARDYYDRKEEVSKAARSSYDRLAAQYDAVVLEGAGSPAEINLMEEDFVNMQMAAYAGAPTVLVADIDRGGVFASIFGTIALLPERYKKYLHGVVINKFRGDPTLLAPGIRQIEELTGVPVLGVLPYLHDLQIEEEDSLGLEKTKNGAIKPVLDVVVIRLPRISNFTDFLAIENDEGIELRYVKSVSEIGNPDLVIIPGTKNTRSDLQWLWERGLAEIISGMAAEGTPVCGICGGYQMLGEQVADPQGVEGEKGVSRGLAMLPLQTVLAPQKTLAQVRGRLTGTMPFVAEPVEFQGYEIHAGVTSVTETDNGNDNHRAMLTIRERQGQKVDEPGGWISKENSVFGCYVHGLFDAPGVRQSLWQWLCARNGKENTRIVISNAGSQLAFDRLADNMEKYLSSDFFDCLLDQCAKP